MSETTPAAVFDCTVFLQALANRKGPAFACWQLVESGRVTLYLSGPVLAEVTEVLNRPELHQKLKTVTPEKVQAYLVTVRTRHRRSRRAPPLYVSARPERRALP